jgi:hypothetical protein
LYRVFKGQRIGNPRRGWSLFALFVGLEMTEALIRATPPVAELDRFVPCRSWFTGSISMFIETWRGCVHRPHCYEGLPASMTHTGGAPELDLA